MIDNERALVACCPGSAAVTDSPRRKRYFTGCLRLVGWAFEGASVIRFRLHTHWRSSFPLKSKTHCFTYCIEGVGWVVQDHRTMGSLVRALVSDRETSGLHLPTID